MKCLKCDKETQVVDSRVDLTNTVRRRRRCPSCYERFTTKEIPVEELETLLRFKGIARGIVESVNSLGSFKLLEDIHQEAQRAKSNSKISL